LGPLAMACIAHDRGYTIGVESAYLPSSLILQEFESNGESP
jgi:hypothetical protein